MRVCVVPPRVPAPEHAADRSPFRAQGLVASILPGGVQVLINVTSPNTFQAISSDAAGRVFVAGSGQNNQHVYLLPADGSSNLTSLQSVPIQSGNGDTNLVVAPAQGDVVYSLMDSTFATPELFAVAKDGSGYRRLPFNPFQAPGMLLATDGYIFFAGAVRGRRAGGRAGEAGRARGWRRY
jgi:hypothetical protein